MTRSPAPEVERKNNACRMPGRSFKKKSKESRHYVENVPNLDSRKKARMEGQKLPRKDKEKSKKAMAEKKMLRGEDQRRVSRAMTWVKKGSLLFLGPSPNRPWRRRLLQDCTSSLLH